MNEFSLGVLQNPEIPESFSVPSPSTVGDTDITGLLKDGRHFARKNLHGNVEIVDSLSGVIRAVMSAKILGGVRPVIERRELPDGSYTLVDSTLPLESTGDNKPTKYDPLIVDLICQKLAEGGSLTAICKDPNMPSYSVFWRWRKMHPSVDGMLEEARHARTEYLRDEAVRIAMENEDHKFPTQAAKLKVDTLMLAAGFDNPKYSPRSKVDVAVSAPTQIMVITGVPEKETIAKEVSHAQINSTPPSAPPPAATRLEQTDPLGEAAKIPGDVSLPGEF